MAKVQIMGGSDPSLVADVNPDGSLEVDIEQSSSIIPTDIQSHLQTTIQTHNAVSVPATTGQSDSSWIDCDGFDSVGITFSNSAATNSAIDIYWSNDNTNIQGFEQGLVTATTQNRAMLTSIKARYLKIRLYNTDASARTMSAWAYLKA